MPHISLTRPSPNTWLLTLSSPPNNLLSASALQDLSEALNVVEYEWLARSPTSSASSTQLKKEDNAKKANIKGAGAGALVLTGEGRSFSAGIDHLALFQLAKQGGDPDSFFPKVFDPVLWRLMTFPLYTVAAINGHAIAAGMILALACDHRIMTSGKGFLSMNEITLGTTLPSSFVSVLSTAFPSRRDLRDTVAGKRWVQNDLLKLGLVDEVSAPGELLKRSVEIGQQEGVKVALGNWGRIKQSTLEPILNLPPARLLVPKTLPSFVAQLSQERRQQVEMRVRQRMRKGGKL
ncbi:hypothetical protein, variant [Cryptococcus amylolentus CBS 6039]|uniref:ClpP/crotonase n=2 Tax=Cryptococcus amylolentus TaxID=104669 RepID=A0A1E3HU85_9TREE|nr:hypothetical protein, variant [Cryptococcus amylolentus CBS 6039]ODN79898.1 hypothetical protein, variant [Cryptococcus amylolentus CBS 6039]ODO08157.1 hypothetical protein I350_03746 [Cryptococcus amylolentus CBS 6273]